MRVLEALRYIGIVIAIALLVIMITDIVYASDEPAEWFTPYVLVEQSTMAELMHHLNEAQEERLLAYDEIQKGLQDVIAGTKEATDILATSSTILMWCLAIVTFQTALIVIIIIGKGWGNE
jgi:hypothetical protein